MSAIGVWPSAVEFIETPTFTKLVLSLLTDDDYAKLQAALALRPETGKVIPGSGGIRRCEMKRSRALKVNPRNDIAKARQRLGMSQSKFADVLGISTATLQNWEQGRREPTGPAKVLLRIALRHPKILLEAA